MKKVRIKILGSWFLILGSWFLATACNNGHEPDAYGNFEAEEVIVSAEAQGRIASLTLEEGQKLNKGQKIGFIDTINLYLRKEQVAAQIGAASARSAQVNAQVAVQEEQKNTLFTEEKRIAQLVASNAAPTKQWDDIRSQLRIIESQIAATKTQNQSIAGEIKALRFQMAQIEDQIAKSYITNPIDGVVLEKFIENGENAIPGKALYKIANLDTLILRVYVSGAQLAKIKTGQEVIVYIDENEKNYRELKGTVSWVSSQAEFTPKIIQTKEERVNMVYAVKIIVPNDGSLKIGMPGEMKIN